MVTPPVMPEPVASDEQIVCPLCDYDLRGLIDPRCPECGYTFDWEDLRNPARRKHKYLFEHHPERNIGSFIRTMIGGLRPRRFWSALLPSQPSRPRRLAIYALVIAISAVLPVVLFMVREISQTWIDAATARSQLTAFLATAPGLARAQQRYPGQSVAQILDQVAPRPTLKLIICQRSVTLMLGYLTAVQSLPILWIAFTIASLTLLQVSLYNARKRQVHLLRCVIYCADVFVWSQVFIAATMLLFIVKTLASNRLGRPAVWWNDEEVILGAFAWSFIAMLPVFWYRLIVAFKKYLHFSHPIPTILLTQFLVFLAVALTLVVTIA